MDHARGSVVGAIAYFPQQTNNMLARWDRGYQPCLKRWRRSRIVAYATTQLLETRARRNLRNAPTPLMKEEGYGKGYQYAHDMPDRVAADMQCLPENLAGRQYYHPVDEGMEARFRARLDELRSKRKA